MLSLDKPASRVHFDCAHELGHIKHRDTLVSAIAATLAAGRLSESVGLEREAERLFGLNRFSIDPSLLRGAGSTPTARVMSLSTTQVRRISC